MKHSPPHLRVLRLIDSICESNSPYQQFTLPLADKQAVTLCTLFQSAEQVPGTIRVFQGNGTIGGFFNNLKRALQARNYDIVHVHSPHLGVLFMLGSLVFRRKLIRRAVYTVHSSYSNYRLKHRLMLTLVMLSYRRIVCCSRSSSTGLDAFCQSVESYWSVHSTEESKAYSREAIQLALSNLETAVKRPDGSSRAAMANAAHLAGKAINIAKTTAAHAMSYPLTSHYDIPHGHAVALAMPSVLKFNAGVGEDDVTDPRGLSYVRKAMADLADLLGAAGPAEAAEKIEHLIGAVGLTMRIADFGAGEGEAMVKTIQAEFDPERAGNNPRKLTAEAVPDILSGD
jgi:hypothetical protein